MSGAKKTLHGLPHHSSGNEKTLLDLPGFLCESMYRQSAKGGMAKRIPPNVVRRAAHYAIANAPYRVVKEKIYHAF